MSKSKLVQMIDDSTTARGRNQFVLHLNRRQLRKLRNHVRQSELLLVHLLTEYVFDPETGWPEDCRVEDALVLTGKMDVNS